ncbi:hypothetical protein [Tsukamurella sp. NPDC003166]|uniref:hypothetical protein n=1 Tax=Tsukamurella sp. NPDC003166 TaxID=3154444 RepID=UPI0033BACA91
MRTTTYRVHPDARVVIPPEARAALDLREIDDGEIRQLAAFLNIAQDDLVQPLHVARLACPACDRRLGILDFVKTAVQLGHHDRSEIADILTGRGGAWVTVRGQDGGRPVNCALCDTRVVIDGADGYCEYTGKNYAYA